VFRRGWRKLSPVAPFTAISQTPEAARRAEPVAPVVALRDVTLHLEENLIFAGLNLSVKKGERLVAMGASGSGKSTLLKLMIGTHFAERGSVRLFGHDIAAITEKMLNALRMRVGLVFQHGALVSSLTVAENLAFQLEELTDKPAEEIAQSVAENLRFVGLANTGGMMPYELSGGMQKRVGIARALMMEPELLLLDEPTAGLDPVSARGINELIFRLNAETAVTLVMIAHKLEEALHVATRIAILDGGKIVEEGTPAEIRGSSEPRTAQFVMSMAAAQGRAR
jgi:phospholipid/cholesterol/gamma-HCH transport system ATP-binding protein